VSTVTISRRAATVRGLKLRRLVPRAALYLILACGAAITLLPFVFMIGVSFTPNVFVLQVPPIIIPSNPTIQNYIDAWGLNNFGRAFMNSLYVSTVSTALLLILAATVAFAVARYRFPGRNVIFYGLLLTMMVPGLVLIIPQFVLASRLHLANNLQGLIIVYAAGIAFSVFMLRAFFEDLPQELFDAAAIDGCGVLRQFVYIAVPLARPALATLAVLSFLNDWSEFVWAATSLNDPNLYTLPVAIQQFVGQHSSNWGIVFAGTTIAEVPMVIAFVLFQRHIVSGIASGALKF